MFDIREIGLDALVDAVHQGFDVAPYGIHVFHAYVGKHHKAPRFIVALAIKAQAQLHFAGLALDLAGQRSKGCQLFGIHDEDAAQLVHAAADSGGGGVIGLEIALLSCQQVAAQAGFRIQHLLHQQIELCSGGLRLGERVQSLQRALIACFINAYH